MKHKINKEEIDKYVRKDMTVEENSRFSKRMQQDEDLHKAVDSYQEIANVAGTKAFMEGIQSELKAEGFFEKNTQGKTVNAASRFGMRRMLAYAASVSVLLIMGSSLWANLNYSNPSLSRIGVAQNTLRTAVERSAGQNQVEINPIYQKLEDQDYSTAIQELKQVLRSNTANEDILENTEWVLLQAKLANDELDADFNNVLQRIINNQAHIHHSNAKLLQRDLSSSWRKLVW